MSTDFREVGLDEIKELLLYKTIKKWDVDKLVLDDGTIVTIEMTDNDCCASAGGEFTDVKIISIYLKHTHLLSKSLEHVIQVGI